MNFRRPSAVVVMEDETFCVKDDNQIFVFDFEGRFVRKFGQKVLNRPYGRQIIVGINKDSYCSGRESFIK